MPWAEEKFGVMVFDMPQDFPCDNGMGTNPIVLALPKTFKLGAVRLRMKDGGLSTG